MTNWSAFYQQHDNQDITDLMHPDEWQLDLAEIIMRHHPETSLEAGSGYGLTSLLLAEGVRKVLFDLEGSPLLTARAIFAHKEGNGEYIAGDVLNMPFSDQSFDLVFNGGVLEHFDFQMRQQAIEEMLRVTSPGGNVIVAIPNHFSIPYRYSYTYRKKHGQWPYPDEYKLYDFNKEIATLPSAGLQSRTTLSRETAYHFLRRHQRIMFKLMGMFREFEGYLTVITIKKC